MSTPYEIQLAHLITMARNPAMRQHAQHRAEQLEACSTGMWRGIQPALKAEISARKAAASLQKPPPHGKSK